MDATSVSARWSSWVMAASDASAADSAAAAVSRASSAAAALMYRRTLKYKAKFESSVRHYGFRR